MAKKKEEVIPVCDEKCKECPEKTPVVLPVTQEFGNGDLNVLRDKINEIISKL